MIRINTEGLTDNLIKLIVAIKESGETVGKKRTRALARGMWHLSKELHKNEVS